MTIDTNSVLRLAAVVCFALACFGVSPFGVPAVAAGLLFWCASTFA
jgi:hypothetical protein